MKNSLKGYLLGSIAAATYGMNPLFALPLYEVGMDPNSVLFFRYLFALPILAIMLVARGRNFRVTRPQVVPLGVLGVIFAFSSLCLFESYNYMSAGIASTMLFVYPIMVVLIMTVFFKEKLKAMTIVCVLMVMAGIGLLYKGSDGATLSLAGTLMVMISALTYAIYIVGINRSHLKEMATIKVTFWVLFSGTFVFAVYALLQGRLTVPPTDHWWLWGNLLCLGLLPTAISLLCTTSAIQYIGSTPTAILGALEPVTAVVIGVCVFHESLTARDIVGLVLIVVAVTLVVAGGSITHPLTRFRKMFPSLRRPR